MDRSHVVAWVADADGERGRAAALALAAAGARVLVTGRDERAIAECVGEIAHGGGTARHFVGDARTPEAARACVEAAVAKLGGLHLAILSTDDARIDPPAGGSLVVLGRVATAADAVREAMAALVETTRGGESLRV